MKRERQFRFCEPQRVAALFVTRFVAHFSQTTTGMLVVRRLTAAENPSQQTVSYFGNTTLETRLGAWSLELGRCR